MMNEQPNEKKPGLWQLIEEDWVANGRDWTQAGFRTVAVYRFGVWRMGVRPRILRLPLSFIYKMLYRYCRNNYGIELLYTSKIGRRLQIAHQGAIVIHVHCTIGDDCVMRQGVTIGALRHGRDQAPVIGDRASLGAGCMVLGPIKVGNDVTVGPNAVVVTNVPDGSTVVAPPSRVIPPPRPRAPKQKEADPIGYNEKTSATIIAATGGDGAGVAKSAADGDGGTASDRTRGAGSADGTSTASSTSGSPA